jgi:DNA-binding FrmR family transcriptional regulator
MGGWGIGGLAVTSSRDRHSYRDEVLSRLQKIEGHVGGIARMVEDGRECEEVILQVGAVKAALNQVALIVFEDHLRSCVAGPETAHRIRTLRSALERLI